MFVRNGNVWTKEQKLVASREFFAAIREGREPNASVAQALPCHEVLHHLAEQLAHRSER